METFLVSALFGIIGTAYFMYGKKRKNNVVLGTGIALCVYPYFIDSLVWTIIIGIVLLLIPVFYQG